MAKKTLSVKLVVLISLIALSITGIVVCGTDSDAAQQWLEYYESHRATFFYDKESVHFPYKDNNKIIAVSTKTVPNERLTDDQEQIGYFLDIVYVNCEKAKYRRKEMLIYSDSEKLIKRRMGIPTYYTIDPGSEPEALFRKVCP